MIKSKIWDDVTYGWPLSKRGVKLRFSHAWVKLRKGAIIRNASGPHAKCICASFSGPFERNTSPIIVRAKGAAGPLALLAPALVPVPAQRFQRRNSRRCASYRGHSRVDGSKEVHNAWFDRISYISHKTVSCQLDVSHSSALCSTVRIIFILILRPFWSLFYIHTYA